MTKQELALQILKTQKRRFTYEEMAQELSVSFVSVYRWITGRNLPSRMAAERILAVFSKSRG